MDSSDWNDTLLIPPADVMYSDDRGPILHAMKAVLVAAGYSNKGLSVIIMQSVESFLQSCFFWHTTSHPNPLRIPQLVVSDILGYVKFFLTDTDFSKNSTAESHADNDWNCKWEIEESTNNDLGETEVVDDFIIQAYRKGIQQAQSYKKSYIGLTVALKASKFVQYIHHNNLTMVKEHHAKFRSFAPTLQDVIQIVKAGRKSKHPIVSFFQHIYCSYVHLQSFLYSLALLPGYRANGINYIH